MEKHFLIPLLLDYYGQLLTPTQFNFVDLYYNQDLSLAEIAEHQKITRQGVRDAIKRGESVLLETEEKLQLVKKIGKAQDTLMKIGALNSEIQTSLSDHKFILEKTQNIETLLKEIEF